MNVDQPDGYAFHCPVPRENHATVQMAHGGGGRVMRRLIEGFFLPAFGSDPAVNPPHDAALVEVPGGRLAMTTDTFVVSPLFFPGGDIGKLAVVGTVNDLAMAGARPLALSAGFILEEGLPLATLERVVVSMRRAADEAGVRIVTGDTKVVDRGKGDGVFINTAGIGVVAPSVDISPRRVAPGDAVLVSGDLGRHGIAVMSVREGLEFETQLESDCASLAGLVAALLDAGVEVHCLRDLTRGGLAAALCEIADAAGVGITLDEASIPVSEPVAGACELLGLDPLYVANEGRLVAFVPATAAQAALDVLRAHPAAVGPAIVGTVTREHAGTVQLHNPLGVDRIVDLLSGEQMPRIC
ncbi:MAG TPA: hydrogenase expression/formation protein HypE [Thermoguttaceae bacterium]|nr:hydrogenase expression/formation protein HypE [Thermoguttaceae bacterium]